jgi:hypothetical protein
MSTNCSNLLESLEQQGLHLVTKYACWSLFDTKEVKSGINI